MKHIFLPAALVVGLAATPAFAWQQHWSDQVTYWRVGGQSQGGTPHPNCLMFQTFGTGGSPGFDNSATGNNLNTKFTGLAQWNVVGVAETDGGNTKQFTSGAVAQMIATSRYSGGQTFTMDWTNIGANTSSIYPGCPSGLPAADNIGQ